MRATYAVLSFNWSQCIKILVRSGNVTDEVIIKYMDARGTEWKNMHSVFKAS